VYERRSLGGAMVGSHHLSRLCQEARWVTEPFVVDTTNGNKPRCSLGKTASQPLFRGLSLNLIADQPSPPPFSWFRTSNHLVKLILFMSSTARRMQARSALRLHTPRRRQRSPSPDPVTIRSPALSTEPGGDQAPTPTPLQATLVKRSKKRENQNPASTSSNHNFSRGNRNDTDSGPVARGDKSKVHKSLSSKNRHNNNQSIETPSSIRTVAPGRRDRDRSLTRGESVRSSKRTSSVEPIEADDDPQLTGPIAVAQYTRLQNEVEKLREVRFKHVMIDPICLRFTHVYSNYNARRRQSRSRVRSLMS